MNVSAEMYIVISLMFAVFAAVAAVGSSIVLGVGFERLRAGFEIVRKQSGFFADAIHKLDERTVDLNTQTLKLREAVDGMGDRVERVEKTTGFFSDAIHSLEQQILEGRPAGQAVTAPSKPTDYADVPEPLLPRSMDWAQADDDDGMTNTDHVLGSLHTLLSPERPAQQEQLVATSAAQSAVPHVANDSHSDARSSRLPELLVSYFRTETRGHNGASKEIVYH